MAGATWDACHELGALRVVERQEAQACRGSELCLASVFRADAEGAVVSGPGRMGVLGAVNDPASRRPDVVHDEVQRRDQDKCHCSSEQNARG